jgi:hypothetical protein
MIPLSLSDERHHIAVIVHACLNCCIMFACCTLLYANYMLLAAMEQQLQVISDNNTHTIGDNTAIAIYTCIM